MLSKLIVSLGVYKTVFKSYWLKFMLPGSVCSPSCCNLSSFKIYDAVYPVCFLTPNKTSYTLKLSISYEVSSIKNKQW